MSLTPFSHPARPGGTRHVALALTLGLLAWPPLARTAARELPPLPELVQQLRALLPDLPEPSPASADAEAYLRQLAPRVLWPSAKDPAPEASVLKTAVYDAGADGATLAYVRLGDIAAETGPQLESAIRDLVGSRHVTGLVLDLRRARGANLGQALPAAAVLAHKPLQGIKLGDEEGSTEPLAGQTPRPVMILIGAETRGAGEVLAAVLRRTATPSLLIGVPTAGEARVYRPLPLSTGERLQVATAPVVLPGGDPLPDSGVAPDLRVAVDPADERSYLTNEFLRVAKGQPTSGGSSFRLNEAELIRRRNGGHGGPLPSIGEEGRPPRRTPRTWSEPHPAPAATVPDAALPSSGSVQDPVLARALDLLSALAVRAESDPPAEGDSR